MRKKLLIISHTEHYLQNGQAIGWGPTITEINFLSQYWEEVVHIACLHPGEAPGSSLPYTSENIRFVAIPPFGGPTWKHKLGIFLKIPSILKKIRKELKGASEVQLRLPTGIGVFLLPWFSLRKRNYTFWVKYAGNWAQEHPPLGYAFQRWWLRKNLARCKVTINGKWPDQPEHCLSFENPCLFEEDLLSGKVHVASKTIEPPFRLIFVGRLEDAKGVTRILDAFEQIDPQLVKEMHFVGNGKNLEAYQKRAEGIDIPISFHGFLNRSEVHTLFKKVDFLLLPSDSEGFPKVIAEAACYGVIPVVSAVSSIPHYIKNENGYLWQMNSSFDLLLQHVLKMQTLLLQEQAKKLFEIAPRFGFQTYRWNLEESIFSYEDRF